MPQIKVCIIDTGVQMDHPDLARNIVKGFNLVRDQASSNYNDRNGHGTHVAGLLAAVANNRLGVAGVASNVRPQ
jgi:subtilisin family serine protease